MASLPCFRGGGQRVPLDVGAIFDLTWKLLLVLGLAILATRALRWLSTPGSAAGGALDILGRVAVGPQQSVVLLRVGKRRLLIGHTSQQITLLADLSADDLAIDENAEQSVARNQITLSDLRSRLTEMRAGLLGRWEIVRTDARGPRIRSEVGNE